MPVNGGSEDAAPRAHTTPEPPQEPDPGIRQLRDAPITPFPHVFNEPGTFLMPQKLCARQEAKQANPKDVILVKLSCFRGPGPGILVA